jgi:hypothetical protein
MNDDLIERLCSWPPSIATLGEAVNRIKQLEAALRKIADVTDEAIYGPVPPSTRRPAQNG